MYLYFMRHGETYWNKARRIQGASDIALTDYGRELARLSGEGFARDGIFFDRIYTSPLKRAVETAEIVSRYTLRNDTPEPSFVVDARLREFSFGKYEGMYLPEQRKVDDNIVNCFQKPSLYHPDPTGESYEALFTRTNSFLYHVLFPLERDVHMKNVLVLCHGTVIRAFLAKINDIALDDFWNLRQPNCSINQVALINGKFTSVRERILYYESEELMNRGIL